MRFGLPIADSAFICPNCLREGFLGQSEAFAKMSKALAKPGRHGSRIMSEKSEDCGKETDGWARSIFLPIPNVVLAYLDPLRSLDLRKPQLAAPLFYMIA